jgi:DNA polymerase-1
MISQHTIFGTLPKALHFQASMYAPWYVYWKDEGKHWAKAMAEDDLWAYNCEDDVYTRTVGEVELQIIDTFAKTDWPKLPEIHEFQQSLFWPVLKAMQRGVRVDEKKSKELAILLDDQIAKRDQWFIDVLGHPLNPQSPDQMHTLFYDDFQITPVLKRVKNEHTGMFEMRPTLDDDALTKIAARDILWRPLCNAIQDHRTLNVLLNTFVLAKRSIDGRMRSSFNIAGSESGESAPFTYRLSSQKDAFGSGANLQNIPSEKSKSMGKAARRGTMGFELPNVRELYIPDPGYTFFDMDLDRADLQTVVWESNEPDFKAAMSMGVDLHLWNAYVLQGKEPPPLDELIEGKHPNYPEHRARNKYGREFAKVFCHGTNYGGGAKTMAGHVGVTVHEADRAQKIWFGAHPGIKKWHDRIQAQLSRTGEFASRRHVYIENQFGYRYIVFERADSVFTEALAWLPQSHTSCVINRIWMNFHKQLPAVETLLQVHDSLAGQFPTHMAGQLIPRMKELSKVVIPYPDDPLVIPTGLKTSTLSWGDCE